MRFLLTVFLTVSAAWGQSVSVGAWSLRGTGGPASSGPAISLISLSLTPANPTQLNGSGVAFTATGTYSDGSSQDLSARSTWSSGNSSVASLGALTTTQLVNCLAAGTSVIQATKGSVSGNTTLSCAAPPTGAGENAYCAGGTDSTCFTGGATDGPAALPTSGIETDLSNTPAPGSTVTLACGGNLQTAINSLTAGQKLVIPAICSSAQDVISGNFTLPVVSGADSAHWNWIETDQTGASGFPPEHTRATPCAINQASVSFYPSYSCASPATLMPQIVSTNGTAVFTADPGTMTVQVAHDQESAEEIFKIVHRFWENLPETMKRGALTRSRANVRQMVFPRIDSEYRVATAADVNAGRGLTIHNLHCSEVARWLRAPDEALASLRAAVPLDGNVILESTPNGAAGVFYEEWQHAHDTGYTRHFFPWWYDDEYRDKTGLIDSQPLSPEEEELVRRAGLSDAQIAWRRTNRAQLRGLAAQEYAEDPVSCFRASGECIFELEAIDRALESQGQPTAVSENGRLTVWLEPRYGRQYIVGVDPAGGGTEGDYACAEVIDRQNAMQCAELHGHYSPRELATKLIELGRTYNSALLVVERNNHGYGVLANLRAAGYQKVFRDGAQDGWLTSAVSKPAMIENLAAILSLKPQLFQSTKLLTECRTFIRRPDGGSGGASGSHDDCVMAMAIALAGREAAAGQK